ncbi:MAG TPA: GNAT family N-acetyltransferase [Humisphaera sp.]
MSDPATNDPATSDRPVGDPSEPRLRHATAADQDAVADLICISTNYWYRASGKPPIFQRGPETCRVFWDVYEAMDPGCCVVAEDPRTGHLMGSCFYRERPTHVALGIMNAHPNYFGRGVANRLLRFITDRADAAGKPVRLVSSAMNLDSFSLYTRGGFHPRALFHDMIVPADRVATGPAKYDASRVRPATAADVPAIADLEWRVSRIRREQDWRHMTENAAGVWHVAVSTAADGTVDGALSSIQHPASNMLGPGVMTGDDAAAGLVAYQLARRGTGTPPLFLVPADRPALVRTIYGWGGKNIELHLFQARGEAQPFAGVAMPTFMPETG